MEKYVKNIRQLGVHVSLHCRFPYLLKSWNRVRVPG